MPGLYQISSNNANVAVTNTTGLYIGNGAASILNNAALLLTLLDNNGNVNFALDPATNNSTIYSYFVGNTGTGGTTYSNANVAAFLPTYGGTINSGTIFNGSGLAVQGPDYAQLQWTNGQAVPASEYDIGLGAWYYIDAGGGVFQSNATGALQTILMSHSGNLTVSNSIITTNGIFWSNGTAYSSGSGSSYGNANVAAFLPTNSSNVAGSYFLGNGSKLTGLTGAAAGTYGSDVLIPSIVVDATGRITSITTNAVSGGGSYGNANVAAFLPTYTGSLALSSTIVSMNANIGTLFLGNASTNANLGAYQTYANATNATTQANIGTLFLGNASTNANLGAYQTYANANAASQQTSINTLNANLGAFETYANLTFGTSTYSNANVAAYLPTYTGTLALSSTIVDLYSNAASQATSINTINANLGAYQTYANANAASQATSINTINANLGAFETYANATFGTSNYSNVNVAAYLASNTDSTISNLNANAAVQAVSINTLNANLGAFETYANATFGTSSYSNVNVAAYLPTYSGSLALSSTIVDLYSNAASQQTSINTINANLGAFQTYSNSNAATQATSINTINANLGAFETYANATFSSNYSNVNVAAYLPTYTGSLALSSTIVGINANLGAYQIYANANAASQATSINSINANIGAYQLYANANIGSYQTYANANAASQATSINTINTNLNNFETYANSTFSTSFYTDANVANYLPIYGGNILLDNTFVRSNLYVQSYLVSTYVFTSNTSWTVPTGNTIVSAKALIIAGGGAGGSATSGTSAYGYYQRSGGGGGAGGTLANVNIINSITPGSTYSIVVGSGGSAGGTVVTARGQISSAFGFTANGGGYGGGSASNAGGGDGGRGGSGGGAYGVDALGPVTYPGTGHPYNQGSSGFESQLPWGPTGRTTGGGAGGGANGPNTLIHQSADGIYDIITGANVYYAPGGVAPYYDTVDSYWQDPLTGNISTSPVSWSGIYGAGGYGAAGTSGTSVAGGSGQPGIVVVQLVQATLTDGTIISNSTVKTGNVIVSNGVFWANGTSYSTGGGGSYGNTQVAAFLPTYTGNIAASNLTNPNTNVKGNLYVYGNVNSVGGTFVGDGSGLTGISASPYGVYTGGGTIENDGFQAIVGPGTAITTALDFSGPLIGISSSTVDSAIDAGAVAYQFGANPSSNYPDRTVNGILTPGMSTDFQTNVAIQGYDVYQQAGWGNVYVVTTNNANPNIYEFSNIGLQFPDNTVQTTAYTGGGSSYGNTQVAAFLPTYSGSLALSSTIVGIQANVGTLFLGNASTNANIGAFQTYSNTTNATTQANIGTLFLGNASTNANIGAFQTYSNTTFYKSGSTITAANVITTNGVFWANGVAYSTGGGGGGSDFTSNLTVNGNYIINANLSIIREKFANIGTLNGTTTINANTAIIQAAAVASNITINTNNITNLGVGQTITLKLTQVTNANLRILTSNILFAGGSKTLSTANAAIDTLSITYDGENYLGALVKGYS